jgi:hypothetical protein
VSEIEVYDFGKGKIVRKRRREVLASELILENTTVSHSENISDMLLKRYHALLKEVSRVETQLHQIIEECPRKTSCYLRYGPYTVDYAPGSPHKGNIKFVDGKFEYDGIEEWQIILAEFYAEQATELLRKREWLLARLYRLASRYIKASGEALVPSLNMRRLRKPWFAKWRKVI